MRVEASRSMVLGDTKRALLQVEGLRVAFERGTSRTLAVDGVSFSLKEHGALGIVGESGSGKTVTALAISRLLPSPPADVHAEAIQFQDIDLLAQSPAQLRGIRGRDISMIFQQPVTSLNPMFTIRFQVEEVLREHSEMRARERRERALQLLTSVGLEEPARVLESYPHQLSGGMCQRVMIAMAVAFNPRLLIADEPTTALDAASQAQILALLRKLRAATGTALILITHNLRIVGALVDHVAVMYRGRITEYAPTNELLDQPRHPYTVSLLAALPCIDGHAASAPPLENVAVEAIGSTRGCPFQQRCSRAIARCASENPPASPCGSGHVVACWRPVGHANRRW